MTQITRKRLENALIIAYLEGCHESMRDETWKKERMPLIINKLIGEKK